jgi:hypothetical protein
MDKFEDLVPAERAQQTAIPVVGFLSSSAPVDRTRYLTAFRQGLRGGDFDDRHVEVFCAASARVNVRIFYQPLTAPTGLGLLGVTPRRGFSRSGSAWPGRSQKDGLPFCRGETWFFIAVQGHQLAHRGGAAWSLPLSKRGREWTPNQHAALLGSPSCRSFAQPSPGLWITLFLPRPFLRSGQSPFSAQP